jgi:hypothetical protein
MLVLLVTKALMVMLVLVVLVPNQVLLAKKV